MTTKIHKTAHWSIQLGFLNKNPATAITQKFVALDNAGLAVNATATSTAIAFVVSGGEVGSRRVQVVTDPNVVYEITADRTVVATDKNQEVDLVIVSGQLVADLDASTTDVLRTLGTENFSPSSTSILVTINKTVTQG
jgi:type IV pilus biogenesis protein CpaD/CtpE